MRPIFFFRRSISEFPTSPWPIQGGPKLPDGNVEGWLGKSMGGNRDGGGGGGRRGTAGMWLRKCSCTGRKAKSVNKLRLSQEISREMLRAHSIHHNLLIAGAESGVIFKK